MPDPPAAGYGFTARGSLQGQGDGNGVIEGAISLYPDRPGLVEGEGETPVFWADLSIANLLDGNFGGLTENTYTTALMGTQQVFSQAPR